MIRCTLPPTFLRSAHRRLGRLLFAACAALLVGAALPPPALAQAPLALTAAGPAAGPTVKTDQVQAELVAHAPDGIQPGSTVWVGLQLTHIPEWHTYWKNPGDSGLPTELRWTLPPGITAGDIAWPLPKKFPIGHLANYGYKDTVLLPVALKVDANFQPPAGATSLDVRLQASWLVCRKECIPQEGEFALALPLQGSTGGHAAVFAAAQAAQPQNLPAGAGQQIRIDQNALQLRIAGLPAALQGKTLEFFPETPEVIETAAAWTQAWEGDVWTARVPISPQRSGSPEVMPVVMASAGSGYRAEVRVEGTWPDPATMVATAPASAGVPDSWNQPARGAALGFWAALAGALLGGLILNLMPCVFPVLAIKVLGFAQQGGDRAQHRATGMAYTAGVVLSFVALGVLLLVLRGAGNSLGWGFQLQNPAVVAGLALLFTLIGLNLAGVFGIGSVLPSSLASRQLRHPVANAFLTGVLAVAVASPCTAPFMGASLGLAVNLPTEQALAIFAAIGLGLALPYLLASWVPAVARVLPRPGAWMETLQRFLAFPMFATVAWLVWVLGQQSGINGAAALLALLVAVALLAWTLGLAGRTRRVLGGFAAVLLLVMGWGLGPQLTRPVDTTTAPLAAGWERWEPGRVDQIAASGRPVFVDFTAAWCVTCQYNKTTTLSNSALLAEMATRNVALLRADWTRRDPAITAALQRLGRSGVPVYVMYQQGRAPVVLSELISVQDVRDVLARL